MTLSSNQWSYFMAGPYYFLQLYDTGGLPSATSNSSGKQEVKILIKGNEKENNSFACRYGLSEGGTVQ